MLGPFAPKRRRFGLHYVKAWTRGGSGPHRTIKALSTHDGKVECSAEQLVQAL